MKINSVDKKGRRVKIVVEENFSKASREFMQMGRLSSGVPGYFDWVEMPGYKPVSANISFELDSLMRKNKT